MNFYEGTVLSNKKTMPLGDVHSALSFITNGSDVTKVSPTVYQKWNLIVKLSDAAGPYHNMISSETRNQLMIAIEKWKRKNL